MAALRDIKGRRAMPNVDASTIQVQPQVWSQATDGGRSIYWRLAICSQLPHRTFAPHRDPAALVAYEKRRRARARAPPVKLSHSLRVSAHIGERLARPYMSKSVRRIEFNGAAKLSTSAGLVPLITLFAKTRDSMSFAQRVVERQRLQRRDVHARSTCCAGQCRRSGQSKSGLKGEVGESGTVKACPVLFALSPFALCPLSLSLGDRPNLKLYFKF